MSRIQGPEPERRLVRSFRALAAAERDTLLAFAEFLVQRGATTPEPHRGPREPTPVLRPSTESVVAAIKRLSKAYAMLDRGPMLNETSALMSAHVLQGRPASEVIDDLEALFARHYRDYRAKYPSEG
jgi:hypothetical protein